MNVGAYCRESLEVLSRTNDTLPAVDGMLAVFRAVAGRFGAAAVSDLIEARFSADMAAAERLCRALCPEVRFSLTETDEAHVVACGLRDGRGSLHVAKGPMASQALALALAAVRASAIRPPDWETVDGALDGVQRALDGILGRATDREAPPERRRQDRIRAMLGRLLPKAVRRPTAVGYAR